MTRHLALSALLCLLAACSSGGPEAPAPGGGAEGEGGAGAAARPVAVLRTTQGDIYIRFFPGKAPEHVRNFLAHARSGFYEGTYFHRVFPGFMVQGGDPNTRDDDPSNDGLGGHSHKGPGRFLAPEFNDVHHDRGVVSMARGMDPASAGSQFFIMVAENGSLDGKYTAFGEVIAGMDAVDRIVSQPGRKLAAGGVNPFERQYLNKVDVLSWTEEDIRRKKASSR